MTLESLEDKIVQFIDRWGPYGTTSASSYRPDATSGAIRMEFINELQTLLETYGKAALLHGNLPDTEHPHGMKCPHDRLNEDGICRECRADLRTGRESHQDENSPHTPSTPLKIAPDTRMGRE